MKLIKVEAKNILTKTKLPGADWVINPYIGCGHACLYCYAKFMARWGRDGYGRWGDWVEAKTNGPVLVVGKKIQGSVFLSSVCDPYQPIEKELQLTRRILENLDKNANISILTKSDLILRDIDLLSGFKKLSIGFTINSFAGQESEVFEPGAPTNERRITALKELKSRGFTTYVFVSPIIPELTDVNEVIEKTRRHTDSYWFEFINARAAGPEFMAVLKNKFPKSFAIVSDKLKFKDFIANCQTIIRKKAIKVEDIILHNYGVD